MRQHKNNANARARANMKKAARLEKRVASLVAGSSSAKAPMRQLRGDVRSKIDAAQADAIAAEERAEEAEEELAQLEEQVDVIREKIGRASKACPLPDPKRLQEQWRNSGRGS